MPPASADNKFNEAIVQRSSGDNTPTEEAELRERSLSLTKPLLIDNHTQAVRFTNRH